MPDVIEIWASDGQDLTARRVALSPRLYDKGGQCFASFHMGLRLYSIWATPLPAVD